MKVAFDTLGATTSLPVREADPLPPEDVSSARATVSLDRLYRSQAPKLLRFLTRRSDRQDANDMMHEVFLRFAEAERRGAADIERPDAYLTQVATNLLRNRAREAFQRSTAAVDLATSSMVVATDLTAALEARDMLNRLQNAMLRLSPKTREIFMAHRLDGASYVQIADRTGLSVKTVEWHMSKAIAHLHRALGTRR